MNAQGALAGRPEQGPAVERPPVARQEDGVAPSETGLPEQFVHAWQQDIDPNVRRPGRPDRHQGQIQEGFARSLSRHGPIPESLSLVAPRGNDVQTQLFLPRSWPKSVKTRGFPPRLVNADRTCRLPVS